MQKATKSTNTHRERALQTILCVAQYRQDSRLTRQDVGAETHFGPGRFGLRWYRRVLALESLQ